MAQDTLLNLTANKHYLYDDGFVDEVLGSIYPNNTVIYVGTEDATGFPGKHIFRYLEDGYLIALSDKDVFRDIKDYVPEDTGIIQFPIEEKRNHVL